MRRFRKFRDDRFALTTLQNPNIEVRTYAQLVQAAEQEREWQARAAQYAAPRAQRSTRAANKRDSRYRRSPARRKFQQLPQTQIAPHQEIQTRPQLETPPQVRARRCLQPCNQ
jgi:hypothetical protein